MLARLARAREREGAVRVQTTGSGKEGPEKKTGVGGSKSRTSTGRDAEAMENQRKKDE